LPCCIGEDACSDKWDASFSFHNHLSGRWPAMHSAGCDCTGEECQHPAHSRCTRHCHSFRFFINKVQPLPSRACQKKQIRNWQSGDWTFVFMCSVHTSPHEDTCPQVI
jgi:hypothetical protein